MAIRLLDLPLHNSEITDANIDEVFRVKIAIGMFRSNSYAYGLGFFKNLVVKAIELYAANISLDNFGCDLIKNAIGLVQG